MVIEPSIWSAGVVVRIDCVRVENMVGIDGTVAMDMFGFGRTMG